MILEKKKELKYFFKFFDFSREGNWGWIILIVGIAVQCITHGLHQSSGIIVVEIGLVYRQNQIITGLTKKKLKLININTRSMIIDHQKY